LLYKQWELANLTNPERITDIVDAFTNADVLIALSQPGPDTIKPEWIKLMNDKAIVFVCANPVPEIYPYAAKEAGAFIVATGRGDFANQINNSLGFPGILKGALLTEASRITDNMAIRAAYSLAEFAEKRGISPENIVPTMNETDVFPKEAADVAMQAIKDGVARNVITWEEAYQKAKEDIQNARMSTGILINEGLIKQPPTEMLEEALAWTLNQMSID
jgi:malate dehydrogenase (oxaloacetate-decarboxylating)